MYFENYLIFLIFQDFSKSQIIKWIIIFMQFDQNTGKSHD